LLVFAGLSLGTETTAGDMVLIEPNPDLLSEHRRERLPDALFMISGMPSPTIHHLVAEHRFQLVALPFGRAFNLGALSPDASVDVMNALPIESPKSTAGAGLLKERIIETTIPACTYRVDPAVPDVDLPTLGVRVLIITHRATDPEAVE